MAPGAIPFWKSPFVLLPPLQKLPLEAEQVSTTCCWHPAHKSMCSHEGGQLSFNRRKTGVRGCEMEQAPFAPLGKAATHENTLDNSFSVEQVL